MLTQKTSQFAGKYLELSQGTKDSLLSPFVIPLATSKAVEKAVTHKSDVFFSHVAALDTLADETRGAYSTGKIVMPESGKTRESSLEKT